MFGSGFMIGYIQGNLGEGAELPAQTIKLLRVPDARQQLLANETEQNHSAILDQILEELHMPGLDRRLPAKRQRPDGGIDDHPHLRRPRLAAL